MGMLKIKIFNFSFAFLILLISSFYSSIIEGASIEFNTETLTSKDFNDRLFASEVLRNRDDESLVDALINFLNNKTEDWQIQIRVIRLLGDLKNPKAIGILLEYFDNVFVNHECPAIRLNTAIALSNFSENSKVFEALLNNLHSKDLQVKEAIVESLGKLKRREVLPYLLEILDENSFALRYKALKAIADIGDIQAIPHLRKFIKTEKDPLLKREALNTIRRLY